MKKRKESKTNPKVKKKKELDTKLTTKKKGIQYVIGNLIMSLDQETPKKNFKIDT